MSENGAVRGTESAIADIAHLLISDSKREPKERMSERARLGLARALRELLGIKLPSER